MAGRASPNVAGQSVLTLCRSGSGPGGHAGDTVPLHKDRACRDAVGGSSCLGSCPNSVRCGFSLRELLADLITPESGAPFAASLAAGSPPSPSTEPVSPGSEHVTSSPFLAPLATKKPPADTLKGFTATMRKPDPKSDGFAC